MNIPQNILHTINLYKKNKQRGIKMNIFDEYFKLLQEVYNYFGFNYSLD